jgi:hypothetical protein
MAGSLGKLDNIISGTLDDITNRNKGGKLGEPGLKFQKGSLVNLTSLSDKLTFQFNPSEFEVAHSVNYAKTTLIQSEQPHYQHLSFDGTVLKFSLFFNGMEAPSGFYSSVHAPSSGGFPGYLLKRAEEGLTGFITKRIPFGEVIGTVGGQIDKFFGTKKAQPSLQTRYVQDDLDTLERWMHGTGNKPPPRIQFLWVGYTDFDWILTDYKYKITMMDKNGLPLHATVDVVLTKVGAQR